MVSPEHIFCDSGLFVIKALGIVIVKVWEFPVQPFSDGVTLIVATKLLLVLLRAVNDGMFPVPLAASPIAELLLVHL